MPDLLLSVYLIKYSVFSVSMTSLSVYELNNITQNHLFINHFVISSSTERFASFHFPVSSHFLSVNNFILIRNIRYNRRLN